MTFQALSISHCQMLDSEDRNQVRILKTLPSRFSGEGRDPRYGSGSPEVQVVVFLSWEPDVRKAEVYKGARAQRPAEPLLNMWGTYYCMYVSKWPRLMERIIRIRAKELPRPQGWTEYLHSQQVRTDTFSSVGQNFRASRSTKTTNRMSYLKAHLRFQLDLLFTEVLEL